jgi:steroid 5-alpha reductase family enzyme
MSAILINSALTILALVTVVWIISLIKKDAGIMDSFWGIGFILVAMNLFLQTGKVGHGQLIMLVLVLIWGLRLAGHITIRNMQHGEEDPRYKNWRDQNGKAWWWKSFIKVFLTQGAVMWVVASPIYAVFYNTTTNNQVFAFAGLGLFVVGFLFETIADWQLLNFKKNPANKGRVLNKGLWSLSRHPNYFGEAVLWWGLGLIAVSVGAWWALISPVVMNYLLVRVSGVKMLDELLTRTNPEYASYMQNTSSFIPLMKKNN